MPNHNQNRHDQASLHDKFLKGQTGRESVPNLSCKTRKVIPFTFSILASQIHVKLENVTVESTIQFTSKMEGMCNDLKLATDDNNKFDTWCTENNKKQLGGMQGGGATSSSSSSTANNNDVNKITMEFGVTVLATGYWPQFPSTEIKLPRQLSVALDIFTEWYNQKTQHRKLTWIHSQGTAIVAAKIGKRHDLVCSTLQAVVLLLFSPNKGGSGEDKDKPVDMEMSGLKLTNVGKFVMHKTDTSSKPNFEAAHDKFRRHRNPVCHAVSRKKASFVMLLYQLYPKPETGSQSCLAFYASQVISSTLSISMLTHP